MFVHIPAGHGRYTYRSWLRLADRMMSFSWRPHPSGPGRAIFALPIGQWRMQDARSRSALYVPGTSRRRAVQNLPCRYCASCTFCLFSSLPRRGTVDGEATYLAMLSQKLSYSRIRIPSARSTRIRDAWRLRSSTLSAKRLVTIEHCIKRKSPSQPCK